MAEVWSVLCGWREPGGDGRQEDWGYQGEGLGVGVRPMAAELGRRFFGPSESKGRACRPGLGEDAVL